MLNRTICREDANQGCPGIDERKAGENGGWHLHVGTMLAVVGKGADGRLLFEEGNELGIPFGCSIEFEEAELGTTWVLPEWPEEL